MPERRLKSTSGLTLIEITIAVAIFFVAVAMSAQAIMGMFVSAAVQKDRVAAVQSCRVVLNAVREKKDFYRGANAADLVNWANFFTWINNQNTAKWATYLTETDGTAALKNHQVTVEFRNVTTGAVAVANDNPLDVHVICTWTDTKNRTMSTRLVSRITDR